MRIEDCHIGQRVKHVQYGTGTIKALSDRTADVRFDVGDQRTVSPEGSGLQPVETTAEISSLQLPLSQLIRQTVEATITSLGVEKPGSTLAQLAPRWHKGRLVMHPNDPVLQTKEIELEVFFHKIVMVRNNLRVLEQKINAYEGFSEADKVEWQQYITRCYGSLTTFNVLFKDKADQF